MYPKVKTNNIYFSININDLNLTLICEVNIGEY